ncbi:hypothetical protein SeMB42_g06635 [Synchytrium endobioticum]|uniref:SAC domain-containing protein n=1 Tax=Synchytrium endobioticum TaxID=286115 RepID=A0A507CQA3_9FUNG|nr:hypothetical protein SeMB42_g06635 [Synchytrium endobioticum]TPX41322.1 hypothetical protein SeLEV6574_g06160 [Synchytrium endobioticum]
MASSSASSSTSGLTRFTLYETKSRYYVVGMTISRDHYRVMKIDRTADVQEVNLVCDPTIYSETEVADLLKMICEGNPGGIQRVTSFYGIMGFIRFLEGYYMIIVTKRKVIAVLGGHYIYHVEATISIPLLGPTAKVERKLDESRYIQLITTLDLTKGFYFSYTYDLSQTLQLNLTGLPNSVESNKFVWNTYLLQPVMATAASNTPTISKLQSLIGHGDDHFNLDREYPDWFIRVIHGFVGQFKISVFGKPVFVTLIARRSRHFAGARFFRRGINDKGHVANEVETEQIVHDGTTTSFFIPSGHLGHKPSYTSFVQHRGSIPLFWSQEPSNVVAKPPIEVTRVDPYFSAAALHFDDLFYRYGPRIICLNLVKSKEKTPRESKLLHEYTRCVDYLNQFLPEDRQINYYHFDMAKATKSDDQNVIEYLEDLAEQVLATTGLFHSGAEPYMNALQHSANAATAYEEINRILGRRQNGVVRTNCIDCLDRTNAAQFIIGKCALGHQLYALGVTSSTRIPFDTDATILLNEAFHDHGDILAMQYGGSHLVNTMEGYRKMQDWHSQSRDMYESLRRWASNSFTDAEKQDAINLFLGNYVPYLNNISLWDMKTDFFLHNEDPRSRQPLRSYTRWWTADLFAFLDEPERPKNDSCFEEYYRLRTLSTFADMFAFNMNSTTRLIREDVFSLSPFVVRVNPLQPTRFSIGDVKRYVTLKNMEQQDKAQPNYKKMEAGPRELESRDPEAGFYSTKSLAIRMGHPRVSLQEVKHYRKYTTEYVLQPLTLPASQNDDMTIFSMLTPPTITTTHARIPAPPANPPHPDSSFFVSWVSGASAPLSFSTTHYDKSVYNQYVTSGKTSYCLASIQNEDDSIGEAYERWLMKGLWKTDVS